MATAVSSGYYRENPKALAKLYTSAPTASFSRAPMTHPHLAQQTKLILYLLPIGVVSVRIKEEDSQSFFGQRGIMLHMPICAAVLRALRF